jgi:hypothetical protein
MILELIWGFTAAMLVGCAVMAVLLVGWTIVEGIRRDIRGY